MKLLLFLLILSSNQSLANELRVQYLARHHTLTFTAQNISLKSSELDLSLRKQKCSEVIFKNFHEELKDLAKVQPIDETKEPVTYTHKGKSYRVSPETKLGRFLVLLPEEVKRMKLEEMIRCSN